MAAVNFYRFASAIMELLEPNRRLTERQVELPVETPALVAPAVVKAEETKTVETIAAQLSQAVANASDEQLAQVAAVIKEVAPVANSQTDDAALVAETVKNVATATVNEINDKNADVSTLEKIETAAKTTAITEKIEEKIAAPTLQSAKIMEPISPAVTENAANDGNFWDLYEEIDPSEIRHLGAVESLYSYMSNRSLMDMLNPANDWQTRYDAITEITENAQENSVLRANFEQISTETNSSQVDRDSDDANKARLDEARRSGEFAARLRLERQRFEERINGGRQ